MMEKEEKRSSVVTMDGHDDNDPRATDLSCDGAAQLALDRQQWRSCVVAAWRSGNVVGRINEVTLRRARLVLGWVTVFGGQNHLSISPSHPGQLSLLPSAGRKMSTSQRAVMLCGWGVKAGMVHSTSG